MNNSSDILNCALQHHRAGRIIEAEQLYRQILVEHPENAEVWHLLGLIAHQNRRLEDAIAHYRQVLKLNPSHYDAYNTLAVAFHEQGQVDEAIPYYEKGLSINPNFAEAHNNYANALRDSNRPSEALHHYQQAIALQPNYADAYNNLGLLFFSQQKYQDAALCYQNAIALQPESTDIHNHLGNALNELGDFEGAIQHFQRAIALQPNNAKVYNNWGNVYRDQGHLEVALQYYERAIAIHPQMPESHWNKALTFLLGGNLQQGFAGYEWRWQVKLPNFQPLRPFPGVRWDGSPLHGKTIFLHAEQGMGDLLQFVRYVAVVAKLGGQVILECYSPLIRLIQRLPDIQQVIPYGSPPPRYDVHAPLLSLPHILGTTLETIPAEVPYLLLEDGSRGEPKKNNPLLPLLPSGANSQFKIGIVWSGNSENPYNYHRAIPLSLLLTLAALPGIQLYSLQADPTEADLKALQTCPDVFDLRHDLNDFADTATLIDQLDLVISVDTAVAHLAGGLGKPVWLLLPFAPDWRWMRNRIDSPWYPTMKLFRQPTYGDWDTVISQVKEALLQRTNVDPNRLSRKDRHRNSTGFGTQQRKNHKKRSKGGQARN